MDKVNSWMQNQHWKLRLKNPFCVKQSITTFEKINPNSPHQAKLSKRAVMKKWFKHKHGYLNLDDDNLYFTKSGNWTEISKLKEKNTETWKTNSLMQKIIFISWNVINGGVLIWMTISSILSGNWGTTLWVLILLVAYNVYVFLTYDIYSVFRIPYEKIKKIELENNQVTVTFTDFEGSETVYKLKKLNSEALEIMNGIQLKN